MPLDEDGAKWSCEPCVRGHRSSKCDHFDRIMMKVPKAGRPLAKCPHPKGTCSCQKTYALMVRIPKDSGCLCRPVYEVPMYITETGAQMPLTPGSISPAPRASSSKIQKKSQRKSSLQITSTDGLERMLNGNDAGNDTRISTPRTATRSPMSESSPALSSPAVKEEDTRAPKASCCSTKQAIIPTPAPGSCCATETKQEPEDTVTPLIQIPPAKSCCSTKAPAQRIQPAPPKAPQSSCCASKVKIAPPPVPQTKPNVNMVQERAPPWGFGLQENSVDMISQNMPFTSQTQPQTQYNPSFSTDLQNLQPNFSQQANQAPFPNGNPQALGFNFDSSQPCACGDGCQCLGCATHPHNDATTSHFQQLGYMLSMPEWWGQEVDSPASANGTGQFSPGGVPAMNGHSNGNGVMNEMTNGNGFGGHDGTNSMQQVQHQQMQNTANGNEYFTPYTQPQHQTQHQLQQQWSQPQQQQQQQPQLTRHHSFPTVAAANASLTMQPSAYTEISYPVNLFSDPSSSSFPMLYSGNGAQDCSNTHGTCLCGDDCDCVGCLTHDGHNGISLEQRREEVGMGVRMGLGLGLLGESVDDFGIATQGPRL